MTARHAEQLSAAAQVASAGSGVDAGTGNGVGAVAESARASSKTSLKSVRRRYLASEFKTFFFLPNVREPHNVSCSSMDEVSLATALLVLFCSVILSVFYLLKRRFRSKRKREFRFGVEHVSDLSRSLCVG